MRRRRERPPLAAAGDQGKGAGRAEYTPDPVGNLMSSVTSRCLLCKAPSALLGVFLPGDSQLWGAPAGRERMVGYGLCSPCHDRPDVVELVEQRIFGFVAGGAA